MFTEDDSLVAALRAEVETARSEFITARTEVSRVCHIVPGNGSATPDGALLREQAATRYKLAEQAYGDALKRFAEKLHSFRLL